MKNNRLWNCKNPFQNVHKKVLCVCSAGLLRSPTAAVVLSQPPYEFNTRAAGMDADHALIPIDEVLLEWADEVVCMTKDHKKALEKMTDTPIVCLNIKDSYGYMDDNLVQLIKEAYPA